MIESLPHGTNALSRSPVLSLSLSPTPTFPLASVTPLALSRALCLSLLSALPQPNRIPSTPIVASFRYAVSSLPSPSSTPTRLAVSISPRRTKLKGVPVVCSVLAPRFRARLSRQLLPPPDSLSLSPAALLPFRVSASSFAYAWCIS